MQAEPRPGITLNKILLALAAIAVFVLLARFGPLAHSTATPDENVGSIKTYQKVLR